MVDGGPAGGEAVQWTVYFKEGGVGTFVPYFVRWVAAWVAGRRVGLDLLLRRLRQQQGNG